MTQMLIDIPAVITASRRVDMRWKPFGLLDANITKRRAAMGFGVFVMDTSDLFAWVATVFITLCMMRFLELSSQSFTAVTIAMEGLLQPKSR